MLGKRSAQGNMFSADARYLHFVGEDTFYGFVARHGRELFRDEDFAQLYCLDNGRTSVPPSRLALALLLQAHDKVADEEAKRRADMDLGWKAALGVDTESQLITAVEVVAGNAADGECAAALVEQSEENTDTQVEQIIGDTAFGSMEVLRGGSWQA